MRDAVAAIVTVAASAVATAHPADARSRAPEIRELAR
jgi:hypothetical protein